MKTFRDLRQRDRVTVEDLMAILKDHVYGRFAINANLDVVMELINDAAPSNDEKRALLEIAKEGVRIQREKRNRTAEDGYASVVNFLST